MIQDLVGNVVPAFKATESWANNVIGSALACLLWGYFLYQGVIDPLGGIWTMWPLFGTANQMLAAIALVLCTVVLFKMKRQRYAWVTIVPTAWLVACTVTAGLEKVFSPNTSVGFLAHAARFSNAAAEGKILAPAKTMAEMGRIVFNDRVDATLAGSVRRDRDHGRRLRDRRRPPGVGQQEQHGRRSRRRPRWQVAMTETVGRRTRFVCEMVVKTARLMVGVPDYDTYVAHRQTTHPDQPVMTYVEFFRERQDARYAVGKGRFRGCC